MIVADTGPIIAFARIGRLDILRHVAGELFIPAAVYTELTSGGIERPGASEAERGEWIHRRAVQDQIMVAQLPRFLHRGEREAIVLAQELQAPLLIDERRGRTIATAQGLPIWGSLRVLAEAKRRGFVRQVGPIVAGLVATGYWIEEDLLTPFFRDVGEETPGTGTSR